MSIWTDCKPHEDRDLVWHINDNIVAIWHCVWQNRDIEYGWLTMTLIHLLILQVFILKLL